MRYCDVITNSNHTNTPAVSSSNNTSYHQNALCIESLRSFALAQVEAASKNIT